MFTRRIAAWGLISIFSISCLAGCGTTFVGTKTHSSYRLHRSLSAPVYWEVQMDGTPKKIFDAALEGIKDLGLNVTQQASDQLTGIIRGYFADGTEFGIKVDYDSPGITKLQITAGTTGDKTLVLQIFNALEKHL